MFFVVGWGFFVFFVWCGFLLGDLGGRSEFYLIVYRLILVCGSWFLFFVICKIEEKRVVRSGLVSVGLEVVICGVDGCYFRCLCFFWVCFRWVLI